MSNAYHLHTSFWNGIIQWLPTQHLASLPHGQMAAGSNFLLPLPAMHPAESSRLAERDLSPWAIGPIILGSDDFSQSAHLHPDKLVT